MSKVTEILHIIMNVCVGCVLPYGDGASNRQYQTDVGDGSASIVPVRRQKLKYCHFGHVTRHNHGLENTKNATNCSRETKQSKFKTKRKKDITDTFGTMAIARRVAEDRHRFESFHKVIWAAKSRRGHALRRRSSAVDVLNLLEYHLLPN